MTNSESETWLFGEDVFSGTMNVFPSVKPSRFRPFLRSETEQLLRQPNRPQELRLSEEFNTRFIATARKINKCQDNDFCARGAKSSSSIT